MNELQLNSDLPLEQQLDQIEKLRKELEVKQCMLIDKALRSDNPSAFIKANVQMSDVEQRQPSNSKSYLFDPYLFYNSLGYKDKITQLSYDNLRRMARYPIIRAIIETRKDQVANFGIPIIDESKEGWTIRKKRGLFEEIPKKVSKQEQERIEDLVNFVLNCGVNANKWGGDDFDSFLRKQMNDSLSLDQCTFEIVRNRKGLPIEFFSTDGGTYRLADTYDDNYKSNTKEPTFNVGQRRFYELQQVERVKVKINGYFPAYVQIYDSQIVSEFYPWELSFGIRNATTDINKNGYGVSELEDLVKVITWMLFGDQYNGNFFSQGSAPKGILKVSGNVNPARITEFRQRWESMVAGVWNSWRTPVLEADKMEFVDMQKSNRDMEYLRWMEYLLKTSCSVYKIDPSEIGYHLAGSGALSNTMNQPGSKEKLEFSKKKGLVPLLRFQQSRINKYIIKPLDPEYEFVFTGIAPEDEERKVELNTKKIQYYPLNTFLEENGFDPIPGADKIMLNSQFLQWKQMSMMGGQQSNEFIDHETGEEEGNMYKEFPEEGEEKANPILNDLNKWIEKGMPVKEFS